MRVKDLKDIIAELPDDQRVEIVTIDNIDTFRIATEFRDAKTDQWGALQITFHSPPTLRTTW